MKKNALLILCFMFSTVVFAGEGVQFIKGDASIFKGKKSFLMEFDWSQTSVDGLESEEEYIKYAKSKKDKPEEFEASWEKDKKNLLINYQEFLASKMKKSELNFNVDDPDSEYKMIIRPTHVDTGSPIKYSSFMAKIYILDKAGKEVAIIGVPRVRGAQLSYMTPTVPIRIRIAMTSSANMFLKFIKKNLK